MIKLDWQLLNQIVFNVAKTLQDGHPSTFEEWCDIADELERAMKIAQAEANHLGTK